jgi:hypothetical protein
MRRSSADVELIVGQIVTGTEEILEITRRLPL